MLLSLVGTSALSPPASAAASVPVYRWWNSDAGDWLSVPEGQPSDADLSAAGYVRTDTAQFYVSPAAGSGQVAVHRWWQADDEDWVDVTAGALSDSTMASYGYTDKTLSYYVYPSAAAGRVAVNRWWNAADADWVTLRQGEIADAAMAGYGYTDKTLIGYASPSLETEPVPGGPAITGLSPASGSTAGGTVVTVTGSGLTGATQVSFGGAGGTALAVVSDTELKVTAPPHAAGVVDVRVTAAGTSPVVSAGRFTYAAPQANSTNAPTRVVRFWQPADRDWITVPDHGSQPTDALLSSYGYRQKSADQYFVLLAGSDDPGSVAVYRWWNAADGDWIDVAEGSVSDSSMTSWGYSGKTFQYYAYRNSGSGRVAVNRWWQPQDRDWITLRQGEISDSQLTAWGYTQKTVVAYAPASRGSKVGYFGFDLVQSSVVPDSMAGSSRPHTMSVLEVNPARDPSVNDGYRYLGFYGNSYCGGIWIAQSNDLNASRWYQNPQRLDFPAGEPCRWASALIDEDRIQMVVNDVWDTSITLQTSTDGLNGKSFSRPTVLVEEDNVRNGNPTLFRDPDTGRLYLYWYRVDGDEYQIRVKSSDTFAGLRGSGPTDLGTLVAKSDEVFAAPQMIKVRGTYYLVTETYERGIWRSRVLTDDDPQGDFVEIPGNPVYGSGSACVFQHVVEDSMHSYYCRENVPGNDTTWTLDHVEAGLAPDNMN